MSTPVTGGSDSGPPLLYVVPPTLQLEEACIPGTRQSIITTITNWLNSTNITSSKVLWLADISGSGKSAVARHIGYTTTQSNQLLCSFFFKRDIENQSNTSQVISSMAREIARGSGAIAAEIAQAGSLGEGAGYVEAFHSQITVPLSRHPPERPSLILIDALDESGTPDRRAHFLDALVREVPLLPATVKIMLTSKPAQDIDDALNKLSTVTVDDDDELEVYRLTFDVYGQDNRRDLRKYISHSFERIARLRRSNGFSLPEVWPSNQQKQSLVAHANGLFLWVTVAADYVACANDPEDALEALLALQNRPNPEAAIDALYKHILRSAESNPDFNFPTYYDILDLVLSAPNPLTLSELCATTKRDVGPTVCCLLPVLRAAPFVRIVHQSFREYVRDGKSAKLDSSFLGTPATNDAELPRSPIKAKSRQSSMGNNTVYPAFHLYVPLLSLFLVPLITPLQPRDQIDPNSVSQYPAARGAFGDIWRAKHLDGRDVAIKSIRLYGSLASLGRTNSKRADGVGQIDHPNVLRLLGICVFGGEIGMVSEWMPKGNVTEFTINHPNANKLKLCSEIADGLAYLHNEGIIHGDLKGGNVVIAADGSARLVDFGLAKLTEEALKFSTTSAQRGTTRWMPHELMNPAEESRAVITFASDVYALGMTFLEIYTGNPPFMEMRNDFQVMFAVIQGTLPQRPSPEASPQLINQMWDLMTWCWARNNERRPNAMTVSVMTRSLLLHNKEFGSQH
ncbi:kinase-like protein [Rhizoctonia solani]|uniref:Kinase-like protein n=1 Tax=Rhizoctonia solani TaxID=456999 RepID=A0A8H7I6L4_9AGAM|nr:kinase-like protein [Rhizoctonia solani]